MKRTEKEGKSGTSLNSEDENGGHVEQLGLRKHRKIAVDKEPRIMFIVSKCEAWNDVTWNKPTFCASSEGSRNNNNNIGANSGINITVTASIGHCFGAKVFIIFIICKSNKHQK